MKLKEAKKGRAVHISGRFFLDSPGVEERYAVIQADDSYHGAENANGYSARFYAELPDGFPDDGWISLG